MPTPKLWRRVDREQIAPELVAVMDEAAKIIRCRNPRLSFIVTCGARTEEEQRRMLDSGASQTMRSRHRPDCNFSGMAEAVDIAVTVDGQVSWDWPLYKIANECVQRAANTLQTPVWWGGDWKNLRDGPHFELAWFIEDAKAEDEPELPLK